MSASGDASDGDFDPAKLVLVTGGTGYIASHCVVELLEAGYDVVVLDNLSNSDEESLRRVDKINSAGKKTLAFVNGDIRDLEGLEKLFDRFKRGDQPPFCAVIHFAGLKAVGESVSIPLLYYDNNVTGTTNLLRVMQKHNLRNIVFSSSATVYGEVATVPEGGLKEDQPTSATNAYGRTKLFIEEIMKDVARSEPAQWNIVLLRYFNPTGAHPSGQIGEDPSGIPNNLMPYITQVAIGKRPHLSVFGGDYSTRDGTGVRDFIHVVDLVKGHIAALRYIEAGKVGDAGVSIFNLGTGTGYSVLEMVAAMKKASGKEIPYKIVDRRPGDVAACFANPDKAREELGWVAELGLDRMCEDSWRWQSQNPSGFKDAEGDA
jgi:UDP-glucose 4-epimerase